VPGPVNAFIASGKKLGLQTFIDYCNQYGITPIYVYNSFEGDGQDLVDFVQHVEDLGGQVPYLEFANEPYWDPRALNNVAPYLAATRPLAAALKAFRPATQIGICFAPHGNSANYEKIWNAPLMAEPFFDAVVHHEYHGKQGLGLEETDNLVLPAFTHPGPVFEQMAASLDAEATGYPVWLAEYNIGGDHPPEFVYTGAHGRYISSIFAWPSEPNLRVPILGRYPPLVKPGSTSDALLGAVDVAPTLLDLVGVESLIEMQDQSFAPLLTDPTLPGRDALLTEYFYEKGRPRLPPSRPSASPGGNTSTTIHRTPRPPTMNSTT